MLDLSTQRNLYFDQYARAKVMEKVLPFVHDGGPKGTRTFEPPSYCTIRQLVNLGEQVSKEYNRKNEYRTTLCERYF